jgi:isopentenyl phosphate kinase
LAHRYHLNEASAEKSDLGFVRITTNMQRMGQAIAAAFQAQEVALFPISPSAIFTTDEGRIAASTLDPILEALERGLIPFLWGDAVLDRSHTYRILSGDQIMTYLCEQLQIADLLFGSDVNGIYTADPRRDPSARRIESVDDANYPAIHAALSSSSRLDVTRGMQGKIEEVYATRKRPVRCTIYNALEPGNTYHALSGEPIGTTLFFTAGDGQ